tara:strand:+ start:2343 stop:2777 length:435 start_codon:yes stop_codon:yes gene_type:complete
MSKEKRERAIAQNGNEGTHYTMTAEELQMLTMTFTNSTDTSTDMFTSVAKERKQTPIFSGVLKYFPDAIAEVAKCSFVGQQQHNPDKTLAWDRSKSGDEYDALMRHLIDSTIDDYDADGTLHLAKVAWRGLAGLQKHLENLNSK